MTLSLHGRIASGALHLLPRHENGLTFALGHALDASPRLLAAFWRELELPARPPKNGIHVALQEHAEEGITDLELRVGNKLVVLVEAKVRGWPGREQLSRYARRVQSEGTGRSVVVPLGVPPFAEVMRIRGVRVKSLRWVEVWDLVNQAQRRRGDAQSQLLKELAAFIGEVLEMQSYNREVLVRDLNYAHPSYQLYLDHDIYACQKEEIAEPLFFAPCFSQADTALGNGIHYVSRVYFRTVVSFKDRAGVRSALERATAVVRKNLEALEGRKGAQAQTKYLKNLPRKWSAGVRRLLKERWRDTNALYFLGDPMRLPVPLRKRGKQVSIGFSMTMEQLMSVIEPGFFNC